MVFVRYMEKNLRFKKKVDKKFEGNEVKYCDFRDDLEIYMLEQ